MRADSGRKTERPRSERGLIVCIVKKMEIHRKQKSKEGHMYTKHHYLSKSKRYATTPASLKILKRQQEASANRSPGGGEVASG